MVRQVVHPTAGPVNVLGNPVKMSATPPTVRTPGPALGQDNDAILHELGYSDADIAGLRARKVI
jgi:formyl-CoA transferase